MIHGQPSDSALVAAAIACRGGTSTYRRYPCFRAAGSNGEVASFHETTRSMTPSSRAGGNSGVVQCTKTLLHVHGGSRRNTARTACSAIRPLIVRLWWMITSSCRRRFLVRSSLSVIAHRERPKPRKRRSCVERDLCLSRERAAAT